MLEEEGVDDAFEEGSSAKEDSHQQIGGFESVHVGQEVSAKFTILIVVAPVAADADQHHHQHEQHREYFHDGRH